jgi:hypothetical protein
MTPQALDTIIQLRWFIAVAVLTISVVWILQNEKTKRLALLCAVVDNIENLPAVQASMERLAGDNSPVNRVKRRDLSIAGIVKAFGKTSKVFQGSCGIATVFLAISSISIAGMITSIFHQRHLAMYQTYRQPATPVTNTPAGLVEKSPKKESLKANRDTVTVWVESEHPSDGRFVNTAVYSRLSYRDHGFQHANSLSIDLGGDNLRFTVNN